MAFSFRLLSLVGCVLAASAEAEPLGLRMASGVDPRIDAVAEAAGSWIGPWVASWTGLVPWALALCAVLALQALYRSRARLAAKLHDSDRRCRDLAEQAAAAARHGELAVLGTTLRAPGEPLLTADDEHRAKSDFLASMSHEIRTPLTALIGFTDLILAETALPASVRRNAERVRGGGDALLAIVNDMLEFAQAEAGTLRLDPRPFSLPLVVDECVALVERAAVEKRLALHVELDDALPAGVLGDAARLRQILLNLLNNAIKFTPAGSIRLTIGAAGAPHHHLLFEVSDTGIGIADEDVARLFRRFSQVDGSIRRAFGGMGLGLAIAKALAKLMGGEIGVRSTPGVGSTFWFTLELPPAPLAIDAPTLPAPPTAPRRLDVLVVEDTPINQELVRAVVEVEGHRVDVVCDGADAIMAVSDKAYDLVLMDVQMPHIDGLEATRNIRMLPGLCRFVPIVAMTANVLKSHADAARAAGMNDLLAKPLDFAALRAVLTSAGQGEIGSGTCEQELDRATLDGLVRILGAAKVATMLDSLVEALSARFTHTPRDAGAAMLKAEAHASIAGAAMLGLRSFSALCRRLADAPQDAAVASIHRELMSRLPGAVTAARRAAGDLTLMARQQKLVA